VSALTFTYYKGILNSQFHVPKIKDSHGTRMGSVVLERRFLLKDPIEISENEFRDKVANRHSDGAIAFQRRFVDNDTNQSFQILPHVYQKGREIVEFESAHKEHAEIVDELFVEYTPTEADKAYHAWDFIAQKDHSFHGRISGEGYCRVPKLSEEERAKQFADLNEIERLKILKNKRGCFHWFMPNRNPMNLFTGNTPGSGIGGGCMKKGCSSMGCGLLSLLALLALLLFLWRSCNKTEEAQQQNSNRVIHDTVYIKEKKQIKEFVDTKTVEKTDAILLPNVQFYTNSANLLPYSIQSIQELADYMAAHPNANAIIKGHTDDVGDADANLKLSQERAQTVKQVLVSFGIAAERIQAKGYGERMPKTQDQTVEARAINRRVEVELTNTENVETKRTEKKTKNGN
jgi:outer membrane protein OmpA-like peptidoglycan-associated protein